MMWPIAYVFGMQFLSLEPL